MKIAAIGIRDWAQSVRFIGLWLRLALYSCYPAYNQPIIVPSAQQQAARAFAKS
jgi:hypothetical protein